MTTNPVFILVALLGFLPGTRIARGAESNSPAIFAPSYSSTSPRPAPSPSPAVPDFTQKPNPNFQSGKLLYSSEEPVHSSFSWLNFRFEGIGAYQNAGNSYSLMPTWNPQVSFRGGYTLGFSLGGTVFGNTFNQPFAVLEYEALLGLPLIGSLGVELGGGAQTWTGYGSTAPLLSTNLYYQFKGGPFERVFVGYSGYFMNFFYTSEIKLGVGFSF